MTVGQLTKALGAREYRYWMVLRRIEPWGEWREDLRAGMVASVFANAHRRKGSQPFKPTDFIPRFEKEKPSPKKLEADFDAFVAGHNAALKKKR